MESIVRMLIASLALFLLEAARNPSWGEAASALLVCYVPCWLTVRSLA